MSRNSNLFSFELVVLRWTVIPWMAVLERLPSKGQNEGLGGNWPWLMTIVCFVMGVLRAMAIYSLFALFLV